MIVKESIADFLDFNRLMRTKLKNLQAIIQAYQDGTSNDNGKLRKVSFTAKNDNDNAIEKTKYEKADKEAALQKYHVLLNHYTRYRLKITRWFIRRLDVEKVKNYLLERKAVMCLEGVSNVVHFLTRHTELLLSNAAYMRVIQDYVNAIVALAAAVPPAIQNPMMNKDVLTNDGDNNTDATK